jgi:hypothetical protein
MTGGSTISSIRALLHPVEGVLLAASGNAEVVVELG